MKSPRKTIILSKLDFTKNVGVTLGVLLNGGLQNVGFSVSSKKVIFEIPWENMPSVETRFHEKRRGYPRIHLRKEDYKT